MADDLSGSAPALSAADSGADRIEKITVDYRRITKLEDGPEPNSSCENYVTWDYSEQLTVDREDETLSYVRNVGAGCRISKIYRIEGGISSFLDSFAGHDCFSPSEGNPPDTIRDPLETRNYKITVAYLSGSPKIFTGSFDKCGLPGNFAGFAESVLALVRPCGAGEILDPAVHGRSLRRKTDLIFCNVQFDDYGKTYCYLTDDDALAAGDCVVVPTGKSNREAVAYIESVEYHPAADAPYPLDKIKKVIGKYNGADETEPVRPPKHTITADSDPLPGQSAETYRSIAGNISGPQELADIYACVNNKFWYTEDSVYDITEGTDEYIKARREADLWETLMEELEQKAASAAAELWPITEAGSGRGSLKQLRTFMEIHGYKDVGRWWIKSSQ